MNNENKEHGTHVPYFSQTKFEVITVNMSLYAKFVLGPFVTRIFVLAFYMFCSSKRSLL